MNDSAPGASTGIPVEGAVQVVPAGPGRFAVRGGLTFRTARAAVETGIRLFGASTATALEADLSGVGAADSAGLAVLIEWLAWAHRNSRHLALTNVPHAIRAIARISEVEGLLAGG